MNLERFREKVRYYRPLTERTQEELANALGLNPSVLSQKLHGIRNARLTHREVQAIVKTLVEWGAMTRQAEARELLELMDCPDFLPDEWNAPPFKWLEATTSTRSVPLRALVVDSSHLNGGAFHSSGRKSGHSISSRSSRASACLVMAPHSTNVLTIAWTSRWVKRAFPVPCSLWLKTYGLRPIALASSSCVLSVRGR